MSGAQVSLAAVTIPISVLVGEAFGWRADEFRRARRALSDGERRYAEAFERERAAAEQLRAVDDMKNTFLQAVSHELRSPLTVILGNALTLEQAADVLTSEERRDLTRRTVANARKLEGLLADLLDVDRLQRGIVLADRRPTDMTELADAVVERLSAAGERAITVETEPLVIDVDGPKVERIVENLLSNALKHTAPDSPVWLRIAGRDGGVLICVDDSGPGVSDQMKEAIFQPFQRGEHATQHTPGTGIGLALVAKFSELHGGRAWVEDRSGAGASFRVFLPCGTPDGQPNLAATSAA